MAQLFRRRANTIAKFTIFGGAGFVAFAVVMAIWIYDSDYVTGIGQIGYQPIPFSHKHHVSDDGIDCRYCHTTVEFSSYAGMPPTSICMTCHAELYSTAAMLEPVRASYQNNESIPWQKIMLLPDYVYFDHSAHVIHGIGCSTCHGRVDTMPLVWRTESFRMDWCVGCHRAPQKLLRPRGEIFNLEWQPPPDQDRIGVKLLKEYNIPATILTDCYTCHR